MSSRDQFGPFRKRRRSLGKPYAPKERDTRRPTVETKSKIKRQVPSYDPEESDTDDDEPETSRTLGSSSQDSLVPRKKKKASPAQKQWKRSDGGSKSAFSQCPTKRSDPAVSENRTEGTGSIISISSAFNVSWSHSHPSSLFRTSKDSVPPCGTGR